MRSLFLSHVKSRMVWLLCPLLVLEDQACSILAALPFLGYCLSPFCQMWPTMTTASVSALERGRGWRGGKQRLPLPSVGRNWELHASLQLLTILTIGPHLATREVRKCSIYFD